MRQLKTLLAYILVLLGANQPASAGTLFGLVSTGELFASEDSGMTWIVRAALPVSDAVALVARTSEQDLYLAGASGSIHRSTDSGVNWDWVGSPPVLALVDMAIASNGDLLVLSATGDLYRSVDLGASFTPLATLGVSNATALTVGSAGRLFALTRTGELYRSQDSGVNWTIRGTVPTSAAVDLAPAGNDLHLVAATGEDYRSPDEGATWSAVGTIGQVGTVSALFHEGLVLAATREGHLAGSTDGAAWTWRGSINQLTLTDLAVDTPQVTGVPDSTIPAPIRVGHPWPNPARSGGSFSINLVLERPTRVGMTLHDAAGRRVATRPDEAVANGTHHLGWDIPGLPSGRYWARIETADGFATTRSWVVIR